ncbi:MAG: AMP-binding protein [bacterium]|nr:AMP-binding protein [bacterium]
MLVSTLSDLVFHVRAVSSGRTDLFAVNRGGRRETLSAADFVRGIHSLALALEARGLEAGERVAICSENRPEWHIVDFACQLLGAPTVPLAPDIERRELAFILRNSGSRWVFYDDSTRRDLLHGLENTFTSPPELVAFDGDAAAPGSLSITRLMGDGASRMGEVPIQRFRGRAREEDPASLVYASGGDEPRGGMLSHREMVTGLIDLDEAFDLTPVDRALAILPLSRGFQRTFDHLCLYRGSAIRYVAQSAALPAALHRERPTVLTAPPDLYERSHRQARAAMEHGGRLRRGLSRWAIEVGKRHAAARRTGFVGPVLAVKRKLADDLIYRGVRRHFGGSLRLAISAGGAMAASAREFFGAVGMPIVSRDEPSAEADADSVIVSPASEPPP